jgi:hypothetical protein
MAGRFKKAADAVVIEHDANERAVIGGNRSPEEIAAEEYAERKTAAKALIVDLYEEAGNFADGEDIKSQEEHDVITALVAQIKAAAAVVEAMRVAEKAPHDIAAKAVQDEFNPFVQKDKGKADKAVKALLAVLEGWRVKEAARKAKVAREIEEEAARKRQAAEDKIRASAGNMAAREDAEEELAEANALDREASRANKVATTGLGLRTVTTVTLMKDPDIGMRWAFDFDAERIFQLVEDMASEHVAVNKLSALAGFDVVKTQAAR